MLSGINVGGEENVCWFSENATVYTVCACAVKTEVRVSEPVLVAWPSGRSIWLLEISNILPRHRMTVQCMHS